MRTPLRSLSFELPRRRKSTDSTRSNGSVSKAQAQNVESDDIERNRRRWMKMSLFSQARHATRPSQESVDGSIISTSPPTRPTSTKSPSSTMTDFLSRESELLGESFGSPTPVNGSGNVDDIDFDAAASAFPDISLDGTGDIPTPAPAAPQVSSDPLSFDGFSAPPRQRTTEVKVTGDDEIERFEDQFPDIEVDKPVRRKSNNVLLCIETQNNLCRHLSLLFSSQPLGALHRFLLLVHSSPLSRQRLFSRHRFRTKQSRRLSSECTYIMGNSL